MFYFIWKKKQRKILLMIKLIQVLWLINCFWIVESTAVRHNNKLILTKINATDSIEQNYGQRTVKCAFNDGIDIWKQNSTDQSGNGW